MISITPGSHAFRIISLLLLVGEYPFQRLDLIGHERTIKAMAVKMSKHQEVRFNHKPVSYCGRILMICGTGRYKTIRLFKWFFPVLEKHFQEEYRYYLFQHPDHKFPTNTDKIDRNHRIAEAMAFVLMSGIEGRPHRTPTLQRMTIDRKIYYDPAYYSSRFVKNLLEAQIQKTQYTRYVGVLFCQTDYYVVYNSRDSVMRWNGEGEQKTTLDISDLCAKNSDYSDLRSAILLGYDDRILLNTIRMCEEGHKYVRLFSQNYHRMHYIPMTEQGRKILQILTLPNWQMRMLRMIFQEAEIKINTGSFQYDALVDGTRVLSFLDSDILKLISFHNVVSTGEFPWAVVCFDVQLDFLRSYLGEDADIQTIELDAFHKEMEAGREPLL